MFYTLVIPDENRSLHTVARDRAEAFAQFGRELGHPITDKDDDSVAPYLLDEWETGPHWGNATIPIFRL